MSKATDKIQAGVKRGIAVEAGMLKDRFASVDETLKGRPRGLLQDSVNDDTSAEVTFPGESNNDNIKKIVRLLISDVDNNPLNARRIYNPETIKERAASLATHGQKTPCTVVEDPERAGKFFLVDGHYRKLGLLAAGKIEIDCIIERNLSRIDLYRLSFMLNEERSPQTPLDNAMAWRQLMDEKEIAKEEDLCALTGKSWGYINKTLSLLSLPESVLSAFKEHPNKIGVTTGYELNLFFKVAGEQETLTLVNQIVEQDLTRDEIVLLRKRLEEPKKRKTKETSRQYRVKNEEGAQIGYIKEWDSGKMAFEVMFQDQKSKEDFLEELKAKFGLE